MALNIPDWLSTRSILFQPHILKSAAENLFFVVVVVLRQINRELQKEDVNRLSRMNKEDVAF